MTDAIVLKRVFSNVNKVITVRNICLTILLLFFVVILVKTLVGKILETFSFPQRG